MDPPSQCWASHVNTILVQTLIAKIFSTKASTNTLELSRIVLSRKNLTSSQSSSDNVAKPSISKLEIPFRAHYRTKWRHFVFDRPFGRARADKMPICCCHSSFASLDVSLAQLNLRMQRMEEIKQKAMGHEGHSRQRL